MLTCSPRELQNREERERERERDGVGMDCLRRALGADAV